MQLESCNPDEIPWLSLNNITCQCRVIDVYDADTVTLILPFENKLFKKKCRLLGIDSAEIRTKNLKEKEYALLSKKKLHELIYDKIIWVKCGDWDKYGRLLGTLYLNKDDLDKDNSINNMLIKEHYAYAYDGKKKMKFEEWGEKFTNENWKDKYIN